ncbi:MAG: dihydrofolate reductase [Xanthobacteraceae bacterium]
MPLAIVLVAAVADNGIIGQGGSLPWRVKSEMQHFRRVTIGKPVVMGRKTFLSLPKPLAARTNIVISRSASFTAAGAVVASTVAAALAVARGDALRRGVDEIAVIGGAEIYRLTLPIADKLLISWIHAEPSGDTSFPPFDQAMWKETQRNDFAAAPGDDASFSVALYERGASARMV